MARLSYEDPHADPAGWAARLGVSHEAAQLYLSSDVIDLHVDSFIWTRVWGYDLTRRHGHGLLGARFYSQVDLPRLREAHVTGALWSVTTNPLRRARRRPAVFVENLRQLTGILDGCPEDVAVVRTAAEYDAARADGKHAAFVSIQGGNALDLDEQSIDLIPDDQVVAITLVHLYNSRLGATSAPLAKLASLFGAPAGLTDFGKDYVRQCNERRIFVDLAHVSRPGFWDAVEVHDKSQPLMDSHTGVDGVNPHWRNLDDAQIKAVADTGGVVGVIYQSTFLGDPVMGGRADTVVRHLEHIIDVAGEDAPALGSDWDGAIITPRDMPTCLELPRLVQLLLERGHSPERIRKILGRNYLESLRRLRG
jgi:membrane dipeptidase